MSILSMIRTMIVISLVTVCHQHHPQHLLHKGTPNQQPNDDVIPSLNHRSRRSAASANLHRPYHICWTIRDAWGQELNKTCNTTLISSYFPTLTFDFAEMLHGKTAYRDFYDPVVSRPPQPYPLYVYNCYLYFCPGHSLTAATSRTCGGVADTFCNSWDCVSTGTIRWTPPITTDFVSITRILPQTKCNFGTGSTRRTHCNQVLLNFTTRGRTAPQWDRGLSWGGRLYDSGSYDYGNVFYLQRHVSFPSTNPIGPNKVIKSTFLQPMEAPPNPLLSLIQSSYEVLNVMTNYTNQPCWLCLSASPPFYEAVASLEAISNSTSDTNCRWSNSTITITAITSVGCCLGHIPANYFQYCANATTGSEACRLWLPKSRSESADGPNLVYTTVNNNISKRLRGFYFLPGNNSLWACSTGATACVSGDVLEATKAFCIQVYLFPKIDVYQDSEFISIMEPNDYYVRAKREIVTALTLSVLLGMGATGAATGIASLAHGAIQLNRLSTEIDADLKRIEVSITALQTSLTSLAEVALQNRRGLDLLFLKQGGMCAALKEECCFYADSSGIVTDSMSQLRDRLKHREQERQSQMSWFQGMFNFSPWITTLISAVIGPLILLLLICLIGPCIFSRVLNLLKTRLNAVDADISKIKILFTETYAKGTCNSHIPTEKTALLSLSDSGTDSSDDESYVFHATKQESCILMNPIPSASAEVEGLDSGIRDSS